MRTAFKVGLVIAIILINVLLAKIVHGQQVMEYNIVEGEMQGVNVKHDFAKASMTVSPENALSIDRNFEQTIHVYNNYTKPLYFFFDVYYDEAIAKIDYAGQILEPSKAGNDSYLAMMSGVVKTANDVAYSNWGDVHHYFTLNGTLVDSFDNFTLPIKYMTNKDNGKFNVSIWASETNDFSCVLDANKTCLFHYHIHPTYTISQLNSGVNSTQGIRNGLNQSGGSGTDQWYGQTFLINGSLQDNVTITNITLEVSSVAGAGNCAVNVRTVNSNTSNITQIDIGNNVTIPSADFGSYKNYTFNFTTNPPSILANESHAFILSCTSVNTVHVYGTSTTLGSYLAGTCIFKDDGGVQRGNCLGIPPAEDLFFVIYYNTTPLGSTNYTVTLQNQTFATPTPETVGVNFTANWSWGANVTNLTNVQLLYNSTLNLTASIFTNGSLGSNHTWRVYNVSNFRPDLVRVNMTGRQFNWSFVVINDNLTNTTNMTGNQTQNITWAFYPEMWQQLFLNITETDQVNWTVNSTNFGNSSNVTFNFYSLWNNTVVLGTVVSNSSPHNRTNTSYSFYTPLSETTPTNVSVNITPILNISFNGTNVSRNTTTFQQTMNRMMMTDCTVTPTNLTGVLYFIRDVLTNVLLTADLTASYTIYNTNISLNRSASVVTSQDGNPRNCRNPQTGQLNLIRSTTANATGYNSVTAPATSFSINLNTSITIFLTSTASSSTITITVTDQNDNELVGYTVEAYFVNSTNETFVDSEITNLQGQVQFSLPITGTLWAFVVKNSAGTTLKRVPTSGGTTIIATSFTIKLILDSRVSLADLLILRGIAHNLTYNNNTFIANLSFNDNRNITLQNCLRILNTTNSNQSTLSNQCTTSQFGNFSYNFSGFNGSYIAQYRAQYNNDSLFYLIDDEYINLQTYPAVGREGILMAFILIGTLAFIGALINPTTTIVLAEVGFLTSWLMGLLPISWYVVAGVLFSGLAIAYAIHKEAL